MSVNKFFVLASFQLKNAMAPSSLMLAHKAKGSVFKRSIVKLIDRLILLLTAMSCADTFAQTQTQTQTKIEHDYISCSMITAEYLTLVQLYQRGIDVNQAIETLPYRKKSAEHRTKEIYDMIANEGLLNTYSFINSNYARCARIARLDRGIPAHDLVEYGYYYCAGENKVRYEIILMTNEHYDLEHVIRHTPDSHIDTAISYFKLIEKKGLLAAFDYTANNLKACLKKL